jgi:thioredoxin-like negative regulator of GroEL
MTVTKSLTADSHDSALSTGTAVLVFMMDQSPACQTFQPVLHQLAVRHASIPFYVVDPEAQADLAELHHLRALPTCIFYRDGYPIRRTAGALGVDEVAAVVDEVLQADMEQAISDLVTEIVATQQILSPLLPRPARLRK